MAELHMFPQNGHQKSPQERLAQTEAHLYHIWQRLNELEQERKKERTDRVATLRYIMGRSLVTLGLVFGALVSKGSMHDTLLQKLWDLIVSFGQ